jgi:cytochrome P450
MRTQSSTPTPRSPASFDPAGAEVSQCPYDFYAALRREAPVYQVPGAAYFLISTHELIQEILRKPELYQNDIRGDIVKTPELKAVYLPTPTLSQCDPPRHAQHRRIVEHALSPARLRALEPGLQALVTSLIDGFIDRGEVDLYREFAVPLPMNLMAELLTGECTHLELFKTWSTALVLPTQGVLSEAEERQVALLAREFNTFFLALFHARRGAPADDLVSVLANAVIEDETTGPRALREDEYISILQQLLTGGNETSSSAICASMLYLAQHPPVVQRLRREPALLETFIEEMLRLESPIQGLWRRVKEETVLGGVRLPAGSLVNIRFGAANRDAARYAAADQLDLARRNAVRHLSFGGGIHFCVGRTLVRKELKCALGSLIARLDNLRLAAWPPLEYRRAFLERSLQALPITFTKRAGAEHV